eukprot:3010001-Pleurochrysis_carterae.AAC.2
MHSAPRAYLALRRLLAKRGGALQSEEVRGLDKPKLPLKWLGQMLALLVHPACEARHNATAPTVRRCFEWVACCCRNDACGCQRTWVERHP